MKRKIFRRIFSAFMALLIAFIGITTVITVIGLNQNHKKAKSFSPVETEEIKIENVGNGVWNIHSDRELKVMQLTDIHLGGGWMSIKKDAMALNAVAAMIQAEKPDFVVASGDIAYPVFFQAGTLNNMSGAKLFAELMETLGVYWTACYGNHDTEAYSYYGRDDITELYEQYPHCLMRKSAEGIDGYGNQVFNIVNSDGVITRSIFTVDSHSYVDGDIFGIFWKYDSVHKNQIEWYRKTVEANKKHNEMKLLESSNSDFSANNPTVFNPKSTVFLHIPFAEYKTAWDEYVANGYADTENVKYNYGAAGEKDPTVYHGIYEDDFFETMLELNSTDSVFCGHDHLNNFSLNYKGIDLAYSLSVDYLAYIGISKLGTQRGCTVMNIAPDGTMETSIENYYQDKYVSQYEKEEVTMQELGK
ncbi:MAG: metallophosphoesterase [Clostridia bacterium]|nr:metallophosphoesterase [Clostridia bacterium]